MTSCSPQPIWFCQWAMEMPPRKLSLKLIRLAEILLSEGKVEEANSVARVALRGFVTFADCQSGPAEGLNVYLSAVEYFASNMCRESKAVRNCLIRLYGRLLHLKHAYLHDWDHAEHPILRSCVIHGLSGGNASALADLTRKSKLWRMNPDRSYVATTGFQKMEDDETIEEEVNDCSGWSNEDSSECEYKHKKKQSRFRGVTERMIEQRKSPTIAEWIKSLQKS